VHLLEKMKIGFFDALDDLAYVTRLFEPEIMVELEATAVA